MHPGQPPNPNDPTAQHPGGMPPSAGQPAAYPPPNQQPMAHQPIAYQPPQAVAQPGHARASSGRVVGMTVLLFVVAFVGSLVIGGTVMTVIVAILGADGDTDMFEALETFGVAAGLGLLTIFVSYILISVLVVRVLLPQGQRALPVVAVLVGPPVLLVGLSFLVRISQQL